MNASDRQVTETMVNEPILVATDTFIKEIGVERHVIVFGVTRLRGWKHPLVRGHEYAFRPLEPSDDLSAEQETELVAA